jgi:hypothetical protein
MVVGVVATGSRSRVPPDLGASVRTRSARMDAPDRSVSGGGAS